MTKMDLLKSWLLAREKHEHVTISEVLILNERYPVIVPLRSLLADAIPSHVHAFSTFIALEGSKKSFLKIGSRSQVKKEVSNTNQIRELISDCKNISANVASSYPLPKQRAAFVSDAISGLTLDFFRTPEQKQYVCDTQKVVLQELFALGIIWPGFANRNILVNTRHAQHHGDDPLFTLVDWERGHHDLKWIATIDGLQRAIELFEEASISVGLSLPYWHSDLPPFHIAHNDPMPFKDDFSLKITMASCPRVFSLSQLIGEPSVCSWTEYIRYSQILSTNNDTDCGHLGVLYAADAVEGAGFLNLRVFLDAMLWHSENFAPRSVSEIRRSILSASAICTCLLSTEFLEENTEYLHSSIYNFINQLLIDDCTSQGDFYVTAILDEMKNYIVDEVPIKGCLALDPIKPIVAIN